MNKNRFSRRLVYLIICFAIIFGTVSPSFVFASDDADSSYSSSNRELLKNIGVISDSDLADEDYTLTRSEFLSYVAKLIKIPEIIDFEENYFSDLKPGEHYTNLINYFAKSGYITVGADKRFEPERKILSEEALTVVLSVLGYKDVMKVKGSYPLNVISVASKLELPNLSIGGEVNETDMVNILADMSKVPFYDIKSIKTNGTIEYKSNDELTILSVYYGIDIAEGYVTGSNGSYFDNSVTGESRMLIDGEYYDAADLIYPQKYIGRYVQMYYTGKDSGNRKAVFCMIADDDDSVVINAQDIDRLTSDYKLKYYKNSGAKVSSVSIERSVSVICNGYGLSSEISRIFNGFDSGYVILSDMDNNGKYDHMAVTKYENVFCGYCDSATQTFYDVISSKSYCLKNFDSVNIYNSEYESMDFEMISSGSVLSVAAYSGKYIEIIVSGSFVSGEVETETYSNGKRQITLNDETYTVYEPINPNTNKPYRAVESKIGYSYKYYTNIFGDIVYSEPDSQGAMLAGYIIDTCVTSGLAKCVKIKMFCEDNIIHEYVFSDKVRCDGNKLNDVDVRARLLDKDGITEPQAILYSQDKDGKIDKIDTVVVGESESPESSLTLYDDASLTALTVFSMGTTAKRRFGRKSLVGTNTKIFKVPNTDIIKNGSWREYMFSTAAPTGFTTDVREKYSSYKTNINHVYTDVLVHYNDISISYTDISNLLLVDRTARIRNSDEVPCDAVVGVSAGANITVPIAENFPKNKALPESGDIVHYLKNAMGEMTDYVKIYDYKTDTLPQDVIFDNVKWDKNILYTASSGSLSQTFTCIFGYAAFKEGTSVAVSSEKTDDYMNTITDAIDLSSYSVMVYDTNARPGAVSTYIGSVEDIKDIKNWGINGCSRIIIHYRYAAVKDIIVYK